MQYNDDWYLTVLGEDEYSGLIDAVSDIPAGFQLHQNYPNPFNPSTTIEYSLPIATHVSLRIYNILGEEIVTLVDRKQSTGFYKLVWDGKNRAGEQVESGIYILKIITNDFHDTRKMIFVK